MPDMSAAGSARGRDVARARRAAMARSGSNAPGATVSRASDTTSSTSRSSNGSVRAPSAATQSGREAARLRREAMARGVVESPVSKGTRPAAPPSLATASTGSGGAPAVAASRPVNAVPSPSSAASEASLTGLSGRALAQARRAMLARAGQVKGSASGSAGGRIRRSPSAENPAAVVAQEPRPSGAQGESVSEADLDQLCTLAETNPSSLGSDAASVRKWCQERRQLVATRGKRGLPIEERKKNRSRQGSGRNGVQPPRGREAARLHREDQCRNGRGDAPSCRPTGRVRSSSSEAFSKVEIGSTLSGRVVSGTQVERKGVVTGNESGSCRTITGTEYIGTEQFATFCADTPAPAPGKVRQSQTSRGSGISGSSIGRAAAVTGDEPGACRTVTGTEYLGSERFAEFCDNKGLLERPEKVVVGATQRKGIRLTGSDEARQNAVTGTEPGTARAITGTQYSDAGQARLTINGPQKVALTHTVAGRAVSGTDVGTGVRITGDEAGSCHVISGTEYLSNEQFQGRCGTTPPPAFTDTGVDRSRKGMRITGNLVDRSEHVTGNEPGSCQRVTGSQYGEPELCGGGIDKVQSMRTLRGTGVTGSRVDHGPKLTGDEHGGCEPVTGTEYVGREQYEAYCESIPAFSAGKVDLSQSNRGLPVSGPPMGRSPRVTGNEPGSSIPVSGTPYVGREQLRVPPIVPGAPSAQAGMPTRRYVAPADAPVRAIAAEDQASRAADRMSATPEPGFSISTPAREGQVRRERITGTGMSMGSRITGPVNKAKGLVSGTPEFRHGDDDLPFAMPPRSPAAMFPPAPIDTGAAYHAGGGQVLPMGTEAPPAVAAETVVVPPVTDRITGDGRDSGPQITGDDWARNQRVTGTEGRWAQSRNPTQRGMPRGTGASARVHAERERPEVPPARVTGSSGNYGKGPVVTVSGGARG
jgi:hypothetical protein